MQDKFYAYVRVSTTRQGESGLGLDAQRIAIENYIRGRGELVGEFVEIESGHKGSKDRPQLIAALDRCKREGAALVLGKLDRIARSVRFFLEVIDDSGVDIRFADLPDVCPASDEGRMILVSMANFAEFEGRRISTRTKAALAAAKARGIRLGASAPVNFAPSIAERKATADAFAKRLSGLFEGFRARQLTQRMMVAELNMIGIGAPRGGHWSVAQVQRVLARLTN